MREGNEGKKYTKVYFYGSTKEEARDSCRFFQSNLINLDEFKSIKSVCVLDFNDPNPPLPCYKWRCYCEYVQNKGSNLMRILHEEA